MQKCKILDVPFSELSANLLIFWRCHFRTCHFRTCHCPVIGNHQLTRSPHGTLTPRNQPHNSSAGTVRTPHVRLPHHARPEPPVACPCALNTTLTMHGARFSPGSRSITCGAPTHCRRTDGTATLPPVCCALPTHCPLRGGAGAASPRPIALVTPNPEPSVRVLTCS